MALKDPTHLFPVPRGVWITVALAILMAIVMQRTVFGRYLFAIGANEAAARLSGIRVRLQKVVIYSLAGIFFGLAGLMQPFHFNKLDEIEAIVAEYGDRLAAIVMEPVRSSEPTPEFIKGIRALADKSGAALIFDEVTSGFRINSGGAHLAYGVDPDMAVFAKAIANGFPMAAIVGRGSVMDAAQETFVSSTAWTERVGPVAALATLHKHREQNVARHLMRIGTRVQKGWAEASTATDLPVHVSGIAPLGHFAFEVPEAQEVRTLFTQMMLDRGIFATGSFYAMWAHTDEHVDRYLEAVNAVFRDLRIAIDQNAVRQLLRGPVAHSGFKRLT